MAETVEISVGTWMRIQAALEKSERQSRTRDWRPHRYPKGEGGDRWLRGTLNSSLTPTGTSTVAVEKWDRDTEEWVSASRTISDVRTGVPLAGNIPSGRVVWIVKKYGEWWVVQWQGPESSVCIDTIEGILISNIGGYDASGPQALVHLGGGCLNWMDIEDCA